MKAEEILEGSKLIAEFEGAAIKNGTISHLRHFSYAHFPKDVYDGMTLKVDLLQYPYSWEWLMPVVEKIESISDPHHGYFSVFINSNGCTIQGTKLHLALQDSSYGGVYFDEVVLDSKINATFTAVVNFITWYNAQTK